MRPRRFALHISATLSPLRCALPQFRPLTLLECAVPKMRPCKSFRMRSYEKRWGEGATPRTSAKSAASILPYILPSYVCSKFFVSHSYENCRGWVVFFPIWHRASDKNVSPERASRVEGSLSPLATRHCFSCH